MQSMNLMLLSIKKRLANGAGLLLYIKTNKKEEIFLLMFPFQCVIIIATKLQNNNNNRKGNIIKMLPPTFCFLGMKI